MNRITKITLASLAVNTAFSAYYIIFGGLTHSWWLLIVGSYYILLSLVRTVVLFPKTGENFSIRFTGVTFIILCIPLVGMVVLSLLKDRGTQFHLVIMLAIAVYSFMKITLAIMNWIKVRKSLTTKWVALRNISLADAFVSIFALQRSMLVTFEGMTAGEIRLTNALTGFAVCCIVFLLGLYLLHYKKGIPLTERD